jgi:hypothetical protein
MKEANDKFDSTDRKHREAAYEFEKCSNICWIKNYQQERKKHTVAWELQKVLTGLKRKTVG